MMLRELVALSETPAGKKAITVDDDDGSAAVEEEEEETKAIAMTDGVNDDDDRDNKYPAGGSAGVASGVDR